MQIKQLSNILMATTQTNI